LSNFAIEHKKASFLFYKPFFGAENKIIAVLFLLLAKISFLC
jgi:hypothetical protein